MRRQRRVKRGGIRFLFKQSIHILKGSCTSWNGEYIHDWNLYLFSFREFKQKKNGFHLQIPVGVAASVDSGSSQCSSVDCHINATEKYHPPSPYYFSKPTSPLLPATSPKILSSMAVSLSPCLFAVALLDGEAWYLFISEGKFPTWHQGIANRKFIPLRLYWCQTQVCLRKHMPPSMI